jgi:hypothetical protein
MNFPMVDKALQTLMTFFGRIKSFCIIITSLPDFSDFNSCGADLHMQFQPLTDFAVHRLHTYYVLHYWI